jgi:hypothetical protein
MSASTDSITIRPAYADDERALRRLATLDSAQLPAMPLLIAEVDGEPRAALSLRDGTSIANPFFPTVHLVDLLALHAAATGPRHPRGSSPRVAGFRRLVPRLG